MKNIITVYDNFFEDPNDVRNKALEQDFYYSHSLRNVAVAGETDDNKILEISKIGDVFPGQRSISCEKILPDIYKELYKKISSFIPNNTPTIHALFQRQTKNDYRNIHQDGKPSLGGLIYLDDNPVFNTGTCFYKHKETDWDGTPSNVPQSVETMQDRFKASRGVYRSEKEEEKARKMRIRIKDEEMNQEEERELDKGEDNFEKHNAIGNKFNRMIMYDANMFHRAEGAGDERLTLSFFVYAGQWWYDAPSTERYF
jgi:hypothetical protein